MSTRALFVTAIVWFVLVGLWLVFGRAQFGITLPVQSRFGKDAVTGLFGVLFFLYELLLVGWMVPLVWALARLATRHFSQT